MKPLRRYRIPTTLCMALAAMALMMTPSSLAATEQKTPVTLALIPFTFNSPRDMHHIRNGILNMFYSRLSWQDHVVVIPQHVVNRQLEGLEDEAENMKVNGLAQKSKSDFILAGSITELAGAFSIDAKVFDIKNERFMAFFQQSPNKDDLIDKVDRMAATINKNVFQRSTLTWDKMEQEKQARINELKRKNPEYMMQNPDWQQTRDSHGWKIWKYLF